MHEQRVPIGPSRKARRGDAGVGVSLGVGGLDGRDVLGLHLHCRFGSDGRLSRNIPAKRGSATVGCDQKYGVKNVTGPLKFRCSGTASSSGRRSARSSRRWWLWPQ